MCFSFLTLIIPWLQSICHYHTLFLTLTEKFPNLHHAITILCLPCVEIVGITDEKCWHWTFRNLITEHNPGSHSEQVDYNSVPRSPWKTNGEVSWRPWGRYLPAGRIWVTLSAKKQCKRITLWVHYLGPLPVRQGAGSTVTPSLELNTSHTAEQFERWMKQVHRYQHQYDPSFSDFYWYQYWYWALLFTDGVTCWLTVKYLTATEFIQTFRCVNAERED